MDIKECEDGSTASGDLYQTLSLIYGYVPHYLGADNTHLIISWDAILRFLGFVGDLKALDIPEPEKGAMMNFFCTIVSNAGANDIGTDFDHLRGLFSFEYV